MIEKDKQRFKNLVRILKTSLKEEAPNEISEHDRLREDLGMNSFNFMVTLYLVETEWGIRLKHENMTSISTVGDLYRLFNEANTNEKVQ